MTALNRSSAPLSAALLLLSACSSAAHSPGSGTGSLGADAGSVTGDGGAPGPCGGAGQACCDGTACNAGFVCESTVCAPFTGPTATLSGSTTLLGLTDWSGTTVTVSGTAITTTTAQDGSWTLKDAPSGYLALDFVNGPFAWTLDGLLSEPGIAPLATMEVPRATWLWPYPQAQNGPFYSGYATLLGSSRSANAAPDVPVAPISVLSVAGRTSFTLERGATECALTPDGTSVVYALPSTSDTSISLRSIPVSGGTPVVLTSAAVNFGMLVEDPGDLPPYSFALSPDGARVVFLSLGSAGDYDVESVPTAGGTTTLLLTLSSADAMTLPGDDGQSEIFFTPDSSEVILCAASELWMVPASGSQPATMLTPLRAGCPYQGNNAVTPDGQRFLYTSEDDQVYAIALQAGAIPVDLGTLYLAGIAPDSSAAIVGGQVVTLSDGSATPLPTGAGSAFFTPDSKAVIFSTASEIDRLTLATQATTTLTSWTQTDSSVGGSRPTLSPDGTTVFCVTRNDADIVTAISLQSGAVTTLATLPVEIGYSSTISTPQLIVSPDGSRIAAVAQFNEIMEVLTLGTSGPGPAQPLLTTYAYESIGWLDGHTLVIGRQGTPAPYSAQDGMYAVPVP